MIPGNCSALEVSPRHSSRYGDVLAAYAFGKSIDQSSSRSEAVNPYTAALSRAISGFDVKHTLVVSANRNLPFEHLVERRNRFTRGWRLSAIARFRTGLPMTLFNNTDTSHAGTISKGINSDGVDTPDVGQMGTASRRFFCGPGMLNFDLALHKDLRLGDPGSGETAFLSRDGAYTGVAGLNRRSRCRQKLPLHY